MLCEKSPQDAPDHYAHQLEHVLEEAQSLAPEENPKAIIFALAFAASKPKLLNPSAPSQQPHLKAWAQDALEQMQDSALQNEVQQLARLMANLDKCCQREAQACAGCSCEVRHGS